jgi:hypothetical protein
MTIWRMRIVYWIAKPTHKHSQYAILIAFPLQRWLHERALLLGYTYIACVVVDPLRMKLVGEKSCVCKATFLPEYLYKYGS